MLRRHVVVAPFAAWAGGVQAQDALQFSACLAKVKNRGRPPTAFLEELVAWANSAPDDIFEPNEKVDVYTRISPELGPWTGLLHRKAAMLEALRVLGGFESSWNWQAGRDTTNPNSNTECTEEAGIFQCSGDSMGMSPALREMVISVGGDDTCDTFRRVSKDIHRFAIEYCARLLRLTVRHHGPLRDRKINAWLRRDAMDEFRRFLT